MLRSCLCLRGTKEDIKELDFRHCNLHSVPEEVYDFELSLEELYLDSNNIKDLTVSLFHCQQLRKLSVSDNELYSVQSGIASLILLQQLDLSKNGIVSIPENIKCCKNLSVIDLSVNPLGKLPEGFTHLTNLTQLYLNDTILKYLPANFGKLTKLTVLELRENHLRSLPKTISKLTELERLDIGSNEFRDLPKEVGDLTKLTELWIDANKITELPTGLGGLTRLVFFDASSNRLEYLPADIENWESLTDLHLSKNYLQELPENMGKLSRLKTLKVDENELAFLPFSIGGLVSIEELILSCNDLEELPPSIGLLRQLSHLNVDENLLAYIPPELGSCGHITVLSLRSNRLKTVPDELGRLSRMTVLNLSDNRLLYLPFSFTKLKAIQALWLAENQSKPLLQLQSDILPERGYKVLTCFLFPQQPKAPEEDIYQSDAESFHASIWEQKRLSNMKIAFDVAELDNQSQVSKKSPNPYPKESGKSLKKAVPNGDVSDFERPSRRHRSNGSAHLKEKQLWSDGNSKNDRGLQLFKADRKKRKQDKERFGRGSLGPRTGESDTEFIAMQMRESLKKNSKSKSRRGYSSDTDSFLKSSPSHSEHQQFKKIIKKELITEADEEVAIINAGTDQTDNQSDKLISKSPEKKVNVHVSSNTPVRTQGFSEIPISKTFPVAEQLKPQRGLRRSGYSTDPEYNPKLHQQMLDTELKIRAKDDHHLKKPKKFMQRRDWQHITRTNEVWIDGFTGAPIEGPSTQNQPDTHNGNVEHLSSQANRNQNSSTTYWSNSHTEPYSSSQSNLSRSRQHIPSYEDVMRSRDVVAYQRSSTKGEQERMKSDALDIGSSRNDFRPMSQNMSSSNSQISPDKMSSQPMTKNLLHQPMTNERLEQRNFTSYEPCRRAHANERLLNGKETNEGNYDRTNSMPHDQRFRNQSSSMQDDNTKGDDNVFRSNLAHVDMPSSPSQQDFPSPPESQQHELNDYVVNVNVGRYIDGARYGGPPRPNQLNVRSMEYFDSSLVANNKPGKNYVEPRPVRKTDVQKKVEDKSHSPHSTRQMEASFHSPHSAMQWGGSSQSLHLSRHTDGSTYSVHSTSHMDGSSPYLTRKVNGSTISPHLVKRINTSSSSPHLIRRMNDSSHEAKQRDEQNLKAAGHQLTVIIHKKPGLGFSITGGLNSPGNPFKHGDQGIFVTKVQPGGAADGHLQPGDKIIQVNQVNFENITHEDAVALLRNNNPVTLLISRE
ncbi:erbin-like [Anneissia japonica]|uniref:erbin-like n=1 Tax=Anneissia japonica TaxID=1529436 RepID=UPI001425A1CA|nr:erbin-like [Anneissia japonica]